jgi:hypothetical protein
MSHARAALLTKGPAISSCSVFVCFACFGVNPLSVAD